MKTALKALWWAVMVANVILGVGLIACFVLDFLANMAFGLPRVIHHALAATNLFVAFLAGVWALSALTSVFGRKRDMLNGFAGLLAVAYMATKLEAHMAERVLSTSSTSEFVRVDDAILAVAILSLIAAVTSVRSLIQGEPLTVIQPK